MSSYFHPSERLTKGNQKRARLQPLKHQEMQDSRVCRNSCWRHSHLILFQTVPWCRAAAAKAVGGRGARYNLGSAQSSKVGVVLTSGFHTQVPITGNFLFASLAVITL